MCMLHGTFFLARVACWLHHEEAAPSHAQTRDFFRQVPYRTSHDREEAREAPDGSEASLSLSKLRLCSLQSRVIDQEAGEDAKPTIDTRSLSVLYHQRDPAPLAKLAVTSQISTHHPASPSPSFCAHTSAEEPPFHCNYIRTLATLLLLCSSLQH